LQNRNPNERDIENVKEQPAEDAKYIEMDLGLGVLEEEDRNGAGLFKTKRERSRDSERRGADGGERAEQDVLAELLGRGMTPEMRERKRRKVGIEVL
ncbi:MAG: hypothetical protein Q9179_007923, partial [Wetmoreana sp. 5 TL-2023]